MNGLERLTGLCRDASRRETDAAMLPSRSALEQALADAGRSHHDYETVVLKGVRDELWPGFYAAFVLGRLGAFTTASRLSLLLEEVTALANWSAAAAAHVRESLS
jgi:hypothetical protein